jgi:hypothetical protein
MKTEARISNKMPQSHCNGCEVQIREQLRSKMQFWNKHESNNEERIVVYHPGGMSEISRGLREAIPPERKPTAPTSFIPEGWQRRFCHRLIFLLSLRDKGTWGNAVRGYRFSQPPANLCNPYRDIGMRTQCLFSGHHRQQRSTVVKSCKGRLNPCPDDTIFNRPYRTFRVWAHSHPPLNWRATIGRPYRDLKRRNAPFSIAMQLRGELL